MVIYFWLAAFILFVVAEIATVGLVSIWFAVGSLAALAAAALGAAMWIQIILFFAVSGVVLAFLRPFVRKHVTPGLHPTNADRVIGMTCPVTEDIDNIAGTGTVSADGKIWTARAKNGEKIAKGALVKPVEIEGVKLIVVPAEQEPDAGR